MVMAIITLLSTIVLGALNNARGKGGDGAVKSQMASLRSQAELFYNVNGNSYSTVCTAVVVGGVKSINNMLRAAANVTGAGMNIAIGVGGGASTATCHDAGGAWAAEAPLKSNTTNVWCVDSTGVSRNNGTTYIPANQTFCP